MKKFRLWNFKCTNNIYSKHLKKLIDLNSIIKIKQMKNQKFMMIK